MIRIRVGSSAVASVGYEAATQVLEVEFTNGSVYQYLDVPEIEYANLIGAESIGEYFNGHVRNSYRCRQL